MGLVGCADSDYASRVLGGLYQDGRMIFAGVAVACFSRTQRNVSSVCGVGAVH